MGRTPCSLSPSEAGPGLLTQDPHRHVGQDGHDEEDTASDVGAAPGVGRDRTEDSEHSVDVTRLKRYPARMVQTFNSQTVRLTG